MLQAQWNFSLSTTQDYSDNPFHFPTPESSLISSYNLGVETKLDSIGVGYYGNYSTFSDMETRNYYWHQFGFWNTKNNFMFGLYAEQRLNQIEFEYFDYTNYNAYVKHSTTIGGVNILSQGAFTLTNYSQLDDLDNWLGTIGTKLNKSFETKTTLIGGLILNYKSYYSTNLDTAQSTVNNRFSYTESTSAYTSQFSYYARVAQSLTSTTGLALQYTGKSIIGGTAKSVRELEYAYGDESQYFDDPISYEGYILSAQLTQLLPEGIILRGSYSYNTKEYPSQGIYTDSEMFNNEEVRNDTQQVLALSLKKNFPLSSLSKSMIILSLNFQVINNESNSYWYDYSANHASINIDFQF
ncbi:MAG: hypothetical protein GY936_14090 [Ignavibacteriae bacterium]|nr:hypothetical protein [Ignavibacteriota bacterium]